MIEFEVFKEREREREREKKRGIKKKVIQRVDWVEIKSSSFIQLNQLK